MAIFWFNRVFVYWDKKLLPDNLNKDNIKKVAISINCGGEEQLIEVSQLENSMGMTQAKPVFSAIEVWGTAEKM